ncbi:MAG: VOC family protein [Candidatus Latescibacterota bacterium]|nr:MAG: VOC family protein [Candidatus Latescibacterota bacterium]
MWRRVLGMRARNPNDDIGWAELDTGACALALEHAQPDDAASAQPVGRFVGVSLQVADIEATYRASVERGVRFDARPQRQAWGGTLAHLRDPDGNVLTLLESRA